MRAHIDTQSTLNKQWGTNCAVHALHSWDVGQTLDLACHSAFLLPPPQTRCTKLCAVCSAAFSLGAALLLLYMGLSRLLLHQIDSDLEGFAQTPRARIFSEGLSLSFLPTELLGRLLVPTHFRTAHVFFLLFLRARAIPRPGSEHAGPAGEHPPHRGGEERAPGHRRVPVGVPQRGPGGEWPGEARDGGRRQQHIGGSL